MGFDLTEKIPKSRKSWNSGFHGIFWRVIHLYHVGEHSKIFLIDEFYNALNKITIAKGKTTHIFGLNEIFMDASKRYVAVPPSLTD